MKYLNQLFLKGLIVVLPITLTLYVLLSVFLKAENFFGGLVKDILGQGLYIPGLGVLVTVLFIMGVGFLVSNFLTGKVVLFFTSQFERMPFIKVIYGPLKDLMSLFSNSQSKDKMQKVVFVRLPGLEVETLALVTREEFSDLPEDSIPTDHVVVYIPMSYMIGGFTAVIHKDLIRESTIPVEKALKLAITGWVKAQN